MSLQKYTAYYTAIFRYVQAFRAFLHICFRLPLLDKVDEQRRHRDRNEGKRDAPERDVGQRREQDGQIGEQVGAGEPPPGQLMDDKGEGVVAAAGPALPHDEPHADADEHAAQQRRRQRPGRQVGQHRGQAFPDPIEPGQAHAGHPCREQKVPPEKFERQRVAGRVEQGRRHRRGHAEPMVDEQHQADDAALGDGGAPVDIMDAERQDGRAQQDHSDPFGGEPAQCAADFLLERLFWHSVPLDSDISSIPHRVKWPETAPVGAGHARPAALPLSPVYLLHRREGS